MRGCVRLYTKSCTWLSGSICHTLPPPCCYKYAPASYSFMAKRMRQFLFYMIMTGIFQSLFELGISGFPRFGAPSDGEDHKPLALDRLMETSQWRANLLHALLFQLYLSVFGEGLILVTSLVTGKEGLRLMQNPVFASESPSDFWGRRWNHVVHQCLKNGVYKPVRSISGSSSAGTIATWCLRAAASRRPAAVKT